VTVADRHNDYAAGVASELVAAGFRAEADLRNEKLGFKIREAQQMKVPVVAVVGDREVEEQTVAPRLRGGRQLEPMPLAQFVGWLAEHNKPGDGGVP
jgi:threonyl-tRNA synthetase